MSQKTEIEIVSDYLIHPIQDKNEQTQNYKLFSISLSYIRHQYQYRDRYTTQQQKKWIVYVCVSTGQLSSLERPLSIPLREV